MVYKRYALSPLRLHEFDVFSQLGLASVLSIGGGRNMSYWTQGGGSDDTQPDPVFALTHEAAYIDFAQGALESACTQVQQLHAGRIPYKADGLFTVDDTQVLGRAARLAALRDEPWYANLIGTLLPGVCVAPTAAKTMPSQSLAIALGHAVEAIPTPESVAALRAALAVIRHSGVEKKLSRNLRPAERALGARPEIALRLALMSGPDPKQDKKRVAMLALCLEAGWYQDLRMTWSEWDANLANAPGGKALAASLIWNAVDSDSNGPSACSFMLDAKSGKPCDPDGLPCAISAHSQISLWHPLLASEAERQAWQGTVMRKKTQQMVRQAFREYYVPLAAEVSQADSSLFAGHGISLVPLIGLARREGWQIDKDCGLLRQFGRVHVQFAIAADLYPGVSGHAHTGNISFAVRDARRWTPMAQHEVPPVVFSEVARAVDLLVSVSAFAIDDRQDSCALTMGDFGFCGAAPSPKDRQYLARTRRLDHLGQLSLSEMGRARRAVLAIVFAEQIANGRLHLDSHHIRVGNYSVHLASARVLNGNAPILLPADDQSRKLSALPWLPYDEVLLQKIVDQVAQLLTQ
ncbi:DUF4132 domain-containing protein [Massilia sp. TSP1-1-2]|uniref:DUF4132 domain-containing protein n=1 Tax=Massilia sp. TSP1-1-2 TaxID=2804649 RepID=UPI003CF42FF4